MASDALTYREPAMGGDDGALRRRAERIVDALLAHGIDHVTGLPDNQSRHIYALLHEHPSVRVVPVCREGEAFAVASGLHAGGAHPAVVIQNTGLLEAGDSIRGTARAMAIPLVCIVGYRGYRTLGTRLPDSVATVTEATLTAWGVPHRVMGTEEETATLDWAFELAQAESRPVVALMP